MGSISLFQYISVRALGAGITALLLGFIFGPKLIKMLQNIGARQAFREKKKLVIWQIYIRRNLLPRQWADC